MWNRGGKDGEHPQRLLQRNIRNEGTRHKRKESIRVTGGYSGEATMKSLQQTVLHKNERNAIAAAARLLKEKYSIDRIILFGSKARGDSDASSDIDLLLISSTKLHWRDEKAVVDALFDIGMEHDVIFSPLFAAADEWEGIFKSFPIYREITRDGAMA